MARLGRQAALGQGLAAWRDGQQSGVSRVAAQGTRVRNSVHGAAPHTHARGTSGVGDGWLCQRYELSSLETSARTAQEMGLILWACQGGQQAGQHKRGSRLVGQLGSDPPWPQGSQACPG